MPQLAGQMTLGTRWIACGWRLFVRNPWLLGGMGLCCSILVNALALIPLMGGPIVALLAPILLASAYLAIEALTKQKMPLPASLRLTAFKQSPRELLGVFREERRVVPIVVASVYSMVVVLLIDVSMRMLAGSAWSKSWLGLDIAAKAVVAGSIFLGLAIYFLLASSLIYALPLTFLRGEPLIPALAHSFRVGLRHALALLVLLSTLLVPIVIAGILSSFSVALAYVFETIAAALLLPVAAGGLYCSYRTVFPLPAAPAQR